MSKGSRKERLLLNGLSPVCRRYGKSRGRPIDRYYIEEFLCRNQDAVKGSVLEMESNIYTGRFGGSQVEKSEVLDIDSGNSRATIIGDLREPDQFPADRFDCIIITQTIHIILETDLVLQSLNRMLKPTGVILATLPSVSRIDPGAGLENDSWRFTPASAKGVFSRQFAPPAEISVEAFGNVVVAAAFLYGFALEDMEKEELDFFDEDYPVLIGVRVDGK